VLYRERSGEKNFVSGGIVRPERFRYSDLKEAVSGACDTEVPDGDKPATLIPGCFRQTDRQD
jgi:hypothetical protein